jgi:hypothetical protein
LILLLFMDVGKWKLEELLWMSGKGIGSSIFNGENVCRIEY